MNLNICHTDTLRQALTAICDDVAERKIVIADISKGWLDTFNFGGVPYGQDKEVHAEIETIKGHKTDALVHAQISRLDSGRYEWLVYVL